MTEENSVSEDFHQILQEKTTGLVSLYEYKKLKQTIVEKRDKKALDGHFFSKKGIEDRSVKRKKGSVKPGLSFTFQDEEDQTVVVPKKRSIRRDPTVETSFLPDQEREIEELKKREELRKKWIKEQEELKEKIIFLPFAFFNGTNRRSYVKVKMKDSIGRIIVSMKDQIPELRRVLNVDKFLFVMGDLIISHHHELYSFYINKSEGPNGLIFDFSLYTAKSAEETITQHLPNQYIPRLVEKTHYLQNRHIFPYNRWLNYDSKKDYSSLQQVNPNTALFYRD
ncbi:xap-5-like protein [Schizosaccharomyces japonicus yFS275]|uniref:Xap-5-like protein n=1 Tax=Schizosaccharomyces japonicus (strain yFS275 / FY16936) TaxID=402676 RepID=B6K6G2_SCHJY|nr:xap-5-like protein [Schizosaccharomyces japonicus yFS275]EEB09116.1 xap-5-like protein [Schizosaccharomyces japonicus yFS275]